MEQPNLPSLYRCCPMCNHLCLDIEKRYTGARYVEEHRNFISVCYECMKEVWEYYDDLWSCYYDSVM